MTDTDKAAGSSGEKFYESSAALTADVDTQLKKVRKAHVHDAFSDTKFVALMVGALAQTSEGVGGKLEPRPAAKQFSKVAEALGQPMTPALTAATELQMMALVDVIRSIGRFLETSIIVNDELKDANPAGFQAPA